MKNSGIPKPILKEIIARPEDIEASSPNMKVVGVYNPGVTTIQEGDLEKTVLMLRVTEVPIEEHKNKILLPYFPVENSPDSPFKIEFDEYKKEELLEIGEKDIRIPGQKIKRLRHISYQLVFFSDDGINIDLKNPVSKLYPCYERERFGLEDFRITQLDGSYVLLHVSPHRSFGASTSIILTEDFRTFERFPPWDHSEPTFKRIKDIALFPEPIPSPHTEQEIEQGKEQILDLARLTRPNAFSDISNPGISIEYAQGENRKGGYHYLLYWGDNHELIVSHNGEFYGTGSPPIKVDGLWLSAFHEVNTDPKTYRTRLLGLSVDKPWKNPLVSRVLIEPNEFGNEGFEPNVVYSTAIVPRIKGGVGDIYSGENDTPTSIRRYYLEDLVRFVKNKDY